MAEPSFSCGKKLILTACQLLLIPLNLQGRLREALNMLEVPISNGGSADMPFPSAGFEPII